MQTVGCCFELRQHREILLAFCGVMAVALGASKAFGQANPTTATPSPQESVHAAAPLALQQLIERVMPSIATIRVNDRDGGQLSIGTGFVVDTAGLIATNYHVLAEGREFSVELWPKKKLKVLAVEASDVAGDFAIVRVEPPPEGLPALVMAEPNAARQGVSVSAFGHPLGLEHSVVSGIISAIRPVDGHDMLQLAMPVEPGNSGGPLVNDQGHVLGIVNIKDLRADNLGFAVPIAGIRSLLKNPNPILYERWVHSPTIDPAEWEVLMGGAWQERSGILHARGSGSGFGGRSLCLRVPQSPVPQSPALSPENPSQNSEPQGTEICVQVKLDDESGAAGLVFHSDGADRHYGFYPSNGRLRLTCFRGPIVDSWEVVQEVSSTAYRPGEWNELKVQIEGNRLLCFVNGKLAIESSPVALKEGRVGLAKFRNTVAQFKRFRVGLPQKTITEDEPFEAWLAQVLDEGSKRAVLPNFDSSSQATAGAAGLQSRLLTRADELRREAARLTKLAEDAALAPVLHQLSQLLTETDSEDLFLGALWIAAIDNPEIDVANYQRKIDRMAAQIRKNIAPSADSKVRLAALDQFLFAESGYHGSRSEYYHPANSQLDRVIDEREGLPITLSILYMELARRLEVTLHGVGLPGHFIVGYQADGGELELIDVFERGRKLTRAEADRMVVQYANRLPTDDDFRPQSTREILIRVLRNLLGTAQNSRDHDALLRYSSALMALDPMEPQFRLMRCAARFYTQRYAAAQADVDVLLRDPAPQMPVEELQRLAESIARQLEE